MITAKIKGDKLVVEADLINPPRDSKTGKTRLVATSGGSAHTDILIDQRPVLLNLNAFFYEDKK